jgi:hypothetical protein
MEEKLGDKNHLHEAGHPGSRFCRLVLLVHLYYPASLRADYFFGDNDCFRETLLRVALPVWLSYGLRNNGEKGVPDSLPKHS